MKILIAVHHLPPNYLGGAEWRAYRTARALIKHGHTVQIICVESINDVNSNGVIYKDDIYDEIPVRRLHFNLANTPSPFLYSYCNPLIGQCVDDVIASFQPDVFHLISGYLMTGCTIESAIAAGVPSVVTLTDFWFLCPRITLMRSDDSLCETPGDPISCALCLRKERRRYRVPDKLSGGMFGYALSFFWRMKKDKLLEALENRRSYLYSLLEKVNIVISPSQFLKKLYEMQGITSPRFLYMRQGLDINRWLVSNPVNDDSSLRIGYIGQIAKHKGVNILIRAFGLLNRKGQNLKLLLYGDTDMFPDFTNQLKKQVGYGDNVIFAGKFDHSMIRQIHSGLDLVVVPSIFYENSPNVILEAFANGTPALVSNLGGMAELVEDGEGGFRFEPGNEESLAKMLQRFIDQPDLAIKLGSKVPKVKSMEDELSELLHAYSSIMTK
jgi:glycosyltransferase involved in cell wall biosynthesis